MATLWPSTRSALFGDCTQLKIYMATARWGFGTNYKDGLSRQHLLQMTGKLYELLFAWCLLTYYRRFPKCIPYMLQTLNIIFPHVPANHRPCLPSVSNSHWRQSHSRQSLPGSNFRRGECTVQCKDITCCFIICDTPFWYGNHHQPIIQNYSLHCFDLIQTTNNFFALQLLVTQGRHGKHRNMSIYWFLSKIVIFVTMANPEWLIYLRGESDIIGGKMI